MMNISEAACRTATPVTTVQDLRASVLCVADEIRRFVKQRDAGALINAATMRDAGRSLMRASRDLRYAIAAETLMHCGSTMSTAQLELLARLLIEDADRVTADPGMLGNGALKLGIRHLDELLNPPPLIEDRKSGTRNKTTRAPAKLTLDDIYDEIRDIKRMM